MEDMITLKFGLDNVVQLPGRFRLQVAEGHLAAEKRFCELPDNPYQQRFNETQDEEDLLKAIAWFAGFRQGLK